jgi:methylated-DNA-[protein]-cysteine S-methyltransferase
VRIAVDTVPAPWGLIHLAASDRGVVALEHLASDEDFLAALERRFGPETAQLVGPPTRGDARGGGAASMLQRAMRATNAFAGGDFRAFDDLPLDLDDRAPWDRRVFAAVREIPPGATASYGEVARMIGTPGAARAVGGAVGRCPIGLAIPCHRVIAADGTLGGYGGGAWGGREAGLALKRDLLAREGVRIGLPSGAGPGMRRTRR